MRFRKDRGQALILTLLAMSIFLLGVLGFAIDVSHLYSQRQLAQAAADGAAMAAAHSIFGETNTSAYSNEYGSADFDCSTSDMRTPCYYARSSGFGKTTSDTVSVAFLNSVPGVTLSSECNPAAVKVTVRRKVETTLMRLLGPSSAYVVAQATAACVNVTSSVPILIVHPTLSGSFRRGGSSQVQVTGGPPKSIQVNSKSPTAVVNNGGGPVDLSKAGPGGSGGALGVWGGHSSYPGSVCSSNCNGLWIGSAGRYGYPDTAMKDPLRNVFPKGVPAPPKAPKPDNSLKPGQGECPSSAKKNCTFYYKGLYDTGTGIVAASNDIFIFEPGLYWIKGGGFRTQSNGDMRMCSACTPDPATGMGMVVYNTGNGANDNFEVGAQGSASLLGSPLSSPYSGILFFQDRSSGGHTHRLGGGGNLSLRGTIYLTNTAAGISGSRYQELLLRGNSGSTTQVEGKIIVDTLDLGGTGAIVMKLYPDPLRDVTQVALVR